MAISLAKVAALHEMTSTNGYLLTFNNANPSKLSWTDPATLGGGAHALNDHTDANFPTPNNGDVIQWNSGAGEWVAAVSSSAHNFHPAVGGGNNFIAGNVSPSEEVPDNIPGNDNAFAGFNVAVSGTLTVSSIRNSGFGVNTFSSLSDGDNNIAMGYQALADLTTGSFNINIGNDSAADLATGDNNVIIGHNTVIGAAANNNVIVGNSCAVVDLNGNDQVNVGNAFYRDENGVAWKQGVNKVYANSFAGLLWTLPSGTGAGRVEIFDELGGYAIFRYPGGVIELGSADYVTSGAPAANEVNLAWAGGGLFVTLGSAAGRRLGCVASFVIEG